MEANDIRTMVESMWLTTPEAELLGCIALTLAEILDAVRSGDTAPRIVEHRMPASIAS
jgi:hypothetical protein